MMKPISQVYEEANVYPDKKAAKILDTATAQELLRLMRMGHPPEQGERFGRFQVMKAIERRGFRILEQLKWDSDLGAIYRNLYVGCEESLAEVLFSPFGVPPEFRKYVKSDDPVEFLDTHAIPRDGNNWDEVMAHNLFSVLENWEPAKGVNIIKFKHDARDQKCKSIMEFV